LQLFDQCFDLARRGAVAPVEDDTAQVQALEEGEETGTGRCPTEADDEQLADFFM
jgi:hypothetical protein